MSEALPDHIDTIDGHYFFPGRAAAYLMVDGDECAFVDNVTRFSVPYLMEGLERRSMRPEQVRYIIVTHIHLDHSGGTAELAKHCPNAQVICHPRAERHIVDPTRLVASARQVYGDTFDEIYGEIEPVAAERVTALADGESLPLGRRTLYFFDSPGHARHHFVIHDPASGSVLSGDAFGLCYPPLQQGSQPYFSYVCAPPEFDPESAQQTVRRIAALAPRQVYVTHFGVSRDVEAGARQLIEALDRYDRMVDEAAAGSLEGDALLEHCTNEALAITKNELRTAGLEPDDEETLRWALAEHLVTSQGLAVLAQRRRDSKANNA